MKKFGLSKKDKSDDAQEDSKRSALFGRSKSKSPLPPQANPYAVPQNNANPYANADPYAKPVSGYGPPPAYGNNAPGAPVADTRTRNEKSPVPPGGYGGQPQRGFASPPAGYGGQGGYGGANPYGGGSNGGTPKGGGYGGLGAEDPNKNALFGGAKDKYEKQKQQQQSMQGQGLPPEEQPHMSGAGGYGQDYGDQDYNRPYQDRQLTVSSIYHENAKSIN